MPALVTNEAASCTATCRGLPSIVGAWWDRSSSVSASYVLGPGMSVSSIFNDTRRRIVRAWPQELTWPWRDGHRQLHKVSRTQALIVDLRQRRLTARGEVKYARTVAVIPPEIWPPRPSLSANAVRRDTSPRADAARSAMPR
ncbi:hypothetical protein PsYK624_032630 [Phanerochaete sordida]|uniref:Uncharacterized protein n=1 Tax=Phanerochaete sordida TaxID=48140 RepID=A0A9P3G3Y4_9APHY|nr:hypothetical protein PsYK624_032630 [Phanerochaete sordida]